METKIIIARTKQLFSLDMLKCHLRITSNESDEYLNYLMTVATDWVEDELGKTLLKQTRMVIHDNNSFCLPYGPVIKVVEVKYHKKLLKEDEYSISCDDWQKVKITVPFRWKCPNVEVMYEAGFGDNPEDIPAALRHAVLGTIEYLYAKKGELTALDGLTAPWLRAHRSYEI